MFERRRVACLLILTCALGFLGCGKKTTKPSLPRSPVSGTVTLGGKPLEGGEVLFQHSSGDSTKVNIVDGKYELQAAEGKNKIAVIWADPQMPNPNPEGMPKMLPGKSHIPEKYASYASSGLEYEVKPGANTYNIGLKP